MKIERANKKHEKIPPLKAMCLHIPTSQSPQNILIEPILMLEVALSSYLSATLVLYFAVDQSANYFVSNSIHA
jgi:hypothetical protein